jgi:hypothetical protein
MSKTRAPSACSLSRSIGDEQLLEFLFGLAAAYRGLCDASAAEPLDADLFVVADDESNNLKIYGREQAEPEGTFDLSALRAFAASCWSRLGSAALPP